MTEERRAPGALIAGIAFAVLVVATFAAFFITQRLKREPGVLGQVRATPFFSPNQDGRFDRARIGFLLQEPDDVTVTVVDADDQPVRRLARNEPLEAYRQLRLVWDGRDDQGARVPDGTYRVRVGLRRQGRSVVIPRNIRLDTAPPQPRVLSIGPEQTGLPRAELLPRRDGQPARVRMFIPGRKGRVLVYRTDVSPAREVLAEDVASGTPTWEWDGTVDGRRVAQGTYLVAVESRDQAGNIGSSPGELPPKPAYGEEPAGRGGISVRYLNAQPPTVPVEAASQAEFGVLSAGERYTWQIRRVGQPRRSNGSGTRPLVRVRAPGGKSGLYLFELRTATRRATVPFPVQSVNENKVLVVLPATTWQGRNRVDDTGDGWPDTLTGGLPVRTARIYDGSGLPSGVEETVAPLLIELDRQGRKYDITTDLALARQVGPQLGDHTGVILAGDTQWMDAGLQRRLRRWVIRGGRLYNVGVQSLRREVRVTPRRALDPTTAAPRDLFGAQLGPVEEVSGTSIVVAEDPLRLFEGTDGQFDGFDAFEATRSLGPASRVVSLGTTVDGEQDVIVATRLNRGLVIRTGLPQLPSRLSSDADLQALVRRIWVLLNQ
ncbi:MAG: hypothetical protein JHC84_12810 [Solirubrobacteraceae bacterium]|nr:hypothetical protein [Solirubrobacteraceae bacterium]